MSEIIGDTACPKCRENGRDKTGNHLMIFSDGGGYCNRCGYKAKSIGKDKVKPRKPAITDEELAEEEEIFNSCPTKAWPKRKLSKETVERFGCKVGMSSSDRTKEDKYLIPIVDKEGKFQGYQVRLIEEKRFWNVGRPKQAALFGQQLLPKGKFNKLYITEAPIDAMSLYQAIKKAWDKVNIRSHPNVVALPHGAGCVNNMIEMNSDVFDRAEEIILVLDNDDAGNEAVAKMCAMYPDCTIVNLPKKDANEMLMAGEEGLLAKVAQFEGHKFKLDGMADISELIEEISEPPVIGTEYPWHTMNKLTYGLREQEIVGVCGGVGMGKTDVKNELIVNFCTKGMHVTSFDLEYSYNKSGKLLASKLAGKPLHRPDIEVTKEEIGEALAPLSGKLSMYKHKGSRDWDEIKRYIRHEAIVHNTKLVMIDPITALVAHLSASEANDTLNAIFSDISSMSQELGFSVLYFAHLNPPKTGPSHERGGKVVEYQMTGSRAMMKWSTHIWGLEGNKDPDIPEHERNVRRMVLLKDREYGNVGSFYLYYNKDTTRLTEKFQ